MSRASTSDRPDSARRAVAYCRAWLPRVSRSFALSIAALGPDLEEAAGLGYLLCRVVDTIEDDEHLADDVQQALFAAFVEALHAPRGAGGHLAEQLRAHVVATSDGGGTAPDDAALCHDAARLFEHYAALPPGSREDLQPSVAEMALGMARIQRARVGGHLVVETWDDLADYCHVVAGTVGELLTKLFVRYTPGIDEAGRRALGADAEAFAQGLQLVNIAKDLPRDAAAGRVFVPREAWPEVSAARLLDPACAAQARAARAALSERAEGHLERALRYAQNLPPGSSARTFCVLPLLLARATLRRLAEHGESGPIDALVKVSRAEAGALASLVTECASNDDVLARCFERAGQIAVIDREVALASP